MVFLYWINYFRRMRFGSSRPVRSSPWLARRRWSRTPLLWVTILPAPKNPSWGAPEAAPPPEVVDAGLALRV